MQWFNLKWFFLEGIGNVIKLFWLLDPPFAEEILINLNKFLVLFIDGTIRLFAQDANIFQRGNNNKIIKFNHSFKWRGTENLRESIFDKKGIKRTSKIIVAWRNTINLIICTILRENRKSILFKKTVYRYSFKRNLSNNSTTNLVREQKPKFKSKPKTHHSTHQLLASSFSSLLTVLSSRSARNISEVLALSTRDSITTDTVTSPLGGELTWTKWGEESAKG